MIRGRRRALGVAVALLAGTAVVAGASDAGAAPVRQSISDSPADSSSGATVDTSTALVTLTGAPLSTSTSVDRGKSGRVKLDGAKTKAYRAQLSAQRNEFKKWLQANAPKAKVTGSFDIAVNAVSVDMNGTTLATLRRAPMVVSAESTGLYHKLSSTVVDPDLALIDAVAAWGAGGAASAGDGVKVAIVDSGIDASHPCFVGWGDNTADPYTNDKVIVAKVFANKAAKYGFDAKAVDSHGTHVAGTVACNVGTTAMVDGAMIPFTISGVAPAAKLGNYNVFPGTIEDARSEDILNALEAAYEDGMDVANMSLGGGASGIQDLLTIAVDNLDKAGMVVAVAAGNEGPGARTVGSPGSAERALTAGASSVPHQVSGSIVVGSAEALSVAGDFGAIPYGTSATLAIVPPVGADASVEVPGTSTACNPVPSVNPALGLAGVIARGTCDFTVKVRNLQNAGYASAIVVNRVPGGAFVMGQNGTPGQPTIPALMIALEDSAVVLGGGTVSFTAPMYRNPFGTANVMADFSSEGPTDVDVRIKPDVVAPGVNVLSSIPGGKFAFFNGTSMATPHLAGAAAVVRGQHPAWTAAQVRSAIVNTADDDALTPFYADDQASDPNLTGSGLLDLAAAVAPEVLLDAVSVSFGVVPSGAGTSKTAVVGLTNVGSAGTLSVSLDGAQGPATFTATLVGSSVVVTGSTVKKAPTGGAWATVRIKENGVEVAHFRVFELVG